MLTTFAGPLGAAIVNDMFGISEAFSAFFAALAVLLVFPQVLMRWGYRSRFSALWSSVVLSLLTIAAGFYFAVGSGFGIAGAIALLYTIFYAIAAILLSILVRNALVSAIGLAVLALLVTSWFGWADSHCMSSPHDWLCR